MIAVNNELFHPVDSLFAEKFLRPYPEATKNASLFLAYMLRAAREGHLCVLVEKDHIVPSLGAQWDRKILQGAYELPASLFEEIIIQKANRWYLRRNWECEERFLKHFNLLKQNSPFIEVSVEAIKTKLKRLNNLQPEQKEAICKAAFQSISLISGGPGTGKTYTAAALIQVFSDLIKGKVAAAAPTGKAAANLRAVLGKEIQVKTLQAFLKKERLPFDLLLVDEASMIDAELMGKLFASLKRGARLVLVGDVYQLPPIESGHFFADLYSKKEHVTELKRCLRAERSEVIDLANRVKENKPLPFSPLPEVKELVNYLTEKLCFEEGIENHYNRFRPLSSLRQGPFGVDHLNQLLYQAHLKRCGKRSLFVPIMITANQPSLDLFNGEIGFLAKDQKCAYFSNSKRISEALLPPYELAYLLSVHKSQGSEYDSVLILLPEGSETFGREMLYTAVTRAKSEVEILSKKPVMESIMSKQSHRLSGVDYYLSK
ncbi:MAG: AAA family ATPase [Chlamydiales bacterium]